MRHRAAGSAWNGTARACDQHGEFAARVAALKQRIDTLEVRLAATEQKQGVFLSAACRS